MLIGAAALSAHVPLHRATADVDIILVSETLEVRALLEALGWRQHPELAHRYRIDDRVIADVLPFFVGHEVGRTTGPAHRALVGDLLARLADPGSMAFALMLRNAELVSADPEQRLTDILDAFREGFFAEQGADALLAADLPRLMKAFHGGPRDDRDRAILLLGFAGAFRASELVGLNVEQLTLGADGLRVFVARSKEDQTGKGAFVDVPRGAQEVTCPVLAVQAWIERVGRPRGPLFRVVHGTVVEH